MINYLLGSKGRGGSLTSLRIAGFHLTTRDACGVCLLLMGGLENLVLKISGFDCGFDGVDDVVDVIVSDPRTCRETDTYFK